MHIARGFPEIGRERSTLNGRYAHLHGRNQFVREITSKMKSCRRAKNEVVLRSTYFYGLAPEMPTQPLTNIEIVLILYLREPASAK